MYENVKTKFDSLAEFVDYYGKTFIDGNGLPKTWTWAMVEHFFKYLEVKGFKLIGQGCYRLCFRRTGRKWIVKVPRNTKGVADCRNEASIYRHRKGKLNPKAPEEFQGALARCRLREIKGVPCLIMPYLEDLRNKPNLHPEWSKQLCDGVQIGKTARGKVVVYDYGNESEGVWTPAGDEKYLGYTNDKLEWNVLAPRREAEKKKLEAAKGVVSVV